MWTGLLWFALLAAAGLCYPRRPRTAGALWITLGVLSLVLKFLRDGGSWIWQGGAYVFGDEIGRPLALATIRDRWDALVERVGLTGLQMRDMRHEGANQYEESGTPVSDVSQLLGHTNLSTTSRYLRNKRRRMAQLAINRLDQARADAAEGRAWRLRAMSPRRRPWIRRLDLGRINPRTLESRERFGTSGEPRL